MHSQQNIPRLLPRHDCASILALRRSLLLPRLLETTTSSWRPWACQRRSPSHRAGPGGAAGRQRRRGQGRCVALQERCRQRERGSGGGWGGEWRKRSKSQTCAPGDVAACRPEAAAAAAGRARVLPALAPPSSALPDGGRCCGQVPRPRGRGLEVAAAALPRWWPRPGQAPSHRHRVIWSGICGRNLGSCSLFRVRVGAPDVILS